jgi:molecular chaperone DnaK (HSP70)
MNECRCDAFGVDRSQKAETILVYLGGGTFDATLMRVDGKDIYYCDDGDHQLGGKDFDDALMKYVWSSLFKTRF